MVAVTFDTLKFTRRLEQAGLPREQAEAQAEALAEAFKVNLADLVTKDDLKREIDRLEIKMDGKFTLLQWMLGALLGINVAVLLKLFL